jgi:hypothetical protein
MSAFSLVLLRSGYVPFTRKKTPVPRSLEEGGANEIAVLAVLFVVEWA